VGIVILYAVENILFLRVVSPYFTDVIQGAILVAVVVVDVLLVRGRQRSVEQAVGLSLFKDPEFS
jgi:ribose/xylose/arabinose/galactoside ABC-type transport system permease subunit